MKGWKTITFNAANAAVLAADVVSESWEIPEEYMPYWIALLFTSNFLLRFVTTTPVGQAE